MFLLPASSLQLIWSPTDLTSCLHPGYIIVHCPPSSCGHHKSHSIQPIHSQGYILIFLDQMHLLFTQVHFLFWQLGWGQYFTYIYIYIYPRVSCRHITLGRWWFPILKTGPAQHSRKFSCRGLNVGGLCLFKDFNIGDKFEPMLKMVCKLHWWNHSRSCKWYWLVTHNYEPYRRVTKTMALFTLIFVTFFGCFSTMCLYRQPNALPAFASLLLTWHLMWWGTAGGWTNRPPLTQRLSSPFQPASVRVPSFPHHQHISNKDNQERDKWLVGLVLWQINHFRLFNAKFSLYIYIKYIWFGWVGFYGISTIVGYLMTNPLYTYILNIYNLKNKFCW